MRQQREQVGASRRLDESVVDAAPQGEYRAIPGASHSNMPLVRPDAVADAVRDGLEQYRARAH